MNNENSIGKNKSKKSKIKGFLIAFLVFIIIKVFVSYALTAYSNSNDHDNVISVLYEEVDKVKKTLPIKGDELTTIEDISFDGATITYSNRIGMLSKDIDEGALESVVEENFKAACKDADMATLLSKQITYLYNYYDVDGTNLGSFELTRDSCQNL